MSVVIKIENLSKQYRLGLVSTRTLSHDINRWYQMNLRRKEDPYLKIGEVNDTSAKDSSNYVWALRDINLEVHEGEVLGIIGKNGAGKSTLLKILSKVTAPTTGIVKAKGRIASLLEVGTGFHPEMTGRENIFMNGAILGMTKAEIQHRFDEIVNFSGVEKFIDTPVKRYSSGMMVRLGFAIAAHLEQEILIVDEVLAVGDAEFQKMAIGKMHSVSKNEGRTVLFVSHNMLAIKSLCNVGIVLEDGSNILKSNSMDHLIAEYITNITCIESQYKIWDNIETSPGNEYLKLIRASIGSKNIKGNGLYTIEDEIEIEFIFHSLESNNNISITIEVFSTEQICVFKSTTNKISTSIKEYSAHLRIPKYFLNNNIYIIDFYFVRDDYKIVFEYRNLLQLEIIESNRNIGWLGKWIGVTRPNFDFKISG